MVEINYEHHNSMEVLESGPFDIKKEDVLNFCRLAGETEPLCTDEEAAKAGPYGVLVAPHMFPYYMGALGMPMVEIVSGMELFGGIELEYLEPLKVGDRIGVSSKIIDITNKKGRSGEMVFITRESEFRNQDAQVALYMRHRMVILDRKVT